MAFIFLGRFKRLILSKQKKKNICKKKKMLNPSVSESCPHALVRNKYNRVLLDVKLFTVLENIDL